LRRSPAALAAVALSAAAGAWFAARALQQDLAAYWIAGAARRLGLDPYVNHVGVAGPGAEGRLWDGVAVFRHSRFLYPPLCADLFRPLAALPYAAAKGLFSAAMLAAWVAAGLVTTGDRRGRTVYFVASALFFPFYRHLERGQIDLLILLLLALAWRARARPLPAGAALAAAAAFKPALVGLVPVVWAGGRGRTALAAIGVGAALAGATLLADGPARLRAYVTEVLPRASLYGEGGTEEMLLAEGALPPGDDGTTLFDGRRYRTEIGSAPATASLPRLLAPEAPSPAVARLPFVLLLGALALRARRLRGVEPERQALLYWAAAVACVVTSPAGWVMGLVLALPLAPLAAALLAEGRLAAGPALAGAVAWVALALPQPFAGWAAIGGAVLVVAAAALAARPTAVST
jgi:hypothetical protein